MPRPAVIERARMYLAKLPPAISGSGGHNATFQAACALIKGFDLSVDDARPLLQAWNAGCQPSWSERELEHKLRSADKAPDPVKRGYLRDEGGNTPVSEGKKPRTSEAAPAPPPAPEMDLDVLRTFAGDWAKRVDLAWLADRSAVDPATVTSEDFLAALFDRAREKVLTFTNDRSQGDAVWPDEKLPERGRLGVWFLAQPVDGQFRPNPRQGTMSRRSEESVTTWRHMVLESDDAPTRLWLGALVQLPLRIVALYTSAGRSVHALVRVDHATKADWDADRDAMKGGLVALGACQGIFTAVRLSRLPGAYRQGKMDKEKGYVRFPKPQLQKLLYLQPNATMRPICDLPRRRNVLEHWIGRAATAVTPEEQEHAIAGARYYARVCPELAQLVGGDL